MKKLDLENMIKELQELKKYSDENLNYNQSVIINKYIIDVIPKLKNEYERMDKDKITVNCPQLFLIKAENPFAKFEGKTLTEYLNDKLKEYILNNYKIIDYGVMPQTNGIYAYIKYTS